MPGDYGEETTSRRTEGEGIRTNIPDRTPSVASWRQWGSRGEKLRIFPRGKPCPLGKRCKAKPAAGQMLYSKKFQRTLGEFKLFKNEEEQREAKLEKKNWYYRGIFYLCFLLLIRLATPLMVLEKDKFLSFFGFVGCFHSSSVLEHLRSFRSDL